MSTAKIAFGNSSHQQMLEIITDFYEEDERVLAVLIFGSLSRGNWDQYSDLDLDIVMIDNISIDARIELQKLCAAIKQKQGLAAIIIADVEEGDVVLENLVEFSIRYHILSDTKPAILDTMSLVSGTLSLDEIRASANYDYVSEKEDTAVIVNAYIRYTLELHNAIMRQRVWMAMEMLHRIRGLLMLLFAMSHDEIRTIHFFDANATPQMQEILSSLSAQPSLESLKAAFCKAVVVIENHLDAFDDQYQLTTSQKQIMTKLKKLQIYREI